MHTVHQLDTAMFAVEIDGSGEDRAALLDWGAHDRLGVVVDRPLGALGASLFIQLAITAFFDVPDRHRRERPLYAEIYLFHAGGRFGEFSAFDFWPARREVFVAGDGAEMLRAVNSHAITHLLVPDGPVESIDHYRKEPETALDRLRKCFTYDPSGRVVDGDVLIRALDPTLAVNVENTLDPRAMLAAAEREPLPDSPAHRRDRLDWLRSVRSRLDEVGPSDRAAMAAARAAISSVGLPTETYRRLPAEAALGRLNGRDWTAPGRVVE